MAYKINDDCTACGTCIDECPVEAISEGDIYKIDPDVCTDCGACADVCPVEAIHPLNRYYNFKEIARGCTSGPFFIADYILLSQESPEYQYFS